VYGEQHSESYIGQLGAGFQLKPEKTSNKTKVDKIGKDKQRKTVNGEEIIFIINKIKKSKRRYNKYTLSHQMGDKHERGYPRPQCTCCLSIIQNCHHFAPSTHTATTYIVEYNNSIFPNSAKRKSNIFPLQKMEWFPVRVCEGRLSNKWLYTATSYKVNSSLRHITICHGPTPPPYCSGFSG